MCSLKNLSKNLPGRYCMTVLCLACLFISLKAQTDINPGMRMVMIYKFAQHVSWKSESKIDTFRFAMYGNDTDLLREMNLLKSVPLKEKPITVSHFSRLRDIEPVHVLYITHERNPELLRVLENTTGRNTLIITDNSDDRKRIMINFLPLENNRIQFEVNKANMLNEGLEALPDLLLLGGTEVDVAELYKESQDALQKVMQQVSKLYDSLKIQSEEIMMGRKEIENQKNLIDSQNREIFLKEQEMLAGEQRLQMLTEQVDESQKTLNSKNRLIETQLKHMTRQDDSIRTRNLILDSIQHEIESQQERIETQRSELNELSVLVQRQKYALVGFIIIFGLVLALIILLFRGYRIKKNANRKLQRMYSEISSRNREINSQKKEIETRKEELERKNEEILAQAEDLRAANEEILSTNEALQNQKQELQFTLENLKLTQNQLVQSEKMASVGQLTAGIAHELNNPINFISGNINPLKRDLVDMLSVLELYDKLVNKQKMTDAFREVNLLKEKIEFEFLVKEIRSLINGIGEGAHRSSEIVKGLRSFSRLDDEKFTEADIHDGLDSTLILLYNKTKNRIKIHKDYGDVPPIKCLPSKLNQVFMNILTNSIQAIEDKGEIFIETISSGIGVKIIIRDTGVGIPPEIKDHIFDPFFTTKDVGSGTGLGLSISYGIIEQHEGNIDVISEPGKGTEFIISLPIRQSDT
jgi:signal transduction histidine kinase